MRIRPLDIRVPESILRDLHARLATTRLPPDGTDSWAAGTSPAYLRELVDYWRTGYDWRAHEAELQRFAHFTTVIDGGHLHFIHERGHGPAPLPIILTHGFPDSYYRFWKLIPLLTHPDDPDDAFDVIVPSLPGYAHSSPAGSLFDIADRWDTLMTGLGYDRYVAHGGDWGGVVTEQLARSHADHVIAVHLTDVPFWHALRKPRRRSAAEDAYLTAVERRQREEGAYAMIQGTRPRTLAAGLADSPAGLAAWLVQLYERWCDGELEQAFTRDELLTSIMIYWTSRSIESAFEPYFDVLHAGPARWIAEAIKQRLGARRVPAGFAMFPAGVSPPREWAERFFDVRRWTEMPRGGHFAAMEQPEALADELRSWFRQFRDRRAGDRVRSPA